MTKNRATDKSPKAAARCPNCAHLEAKLAALEREHEQLLALYSEQRERYGALQEQTEKLEREAHRQAAPFRREDKKRTPQGKSPGRGKGHPGSWRPTPEPEQITEGPVVPLEHCPHCQGPVSDVRAVEQIIQELPVLRVQNIRLTTFTGHCDKCGRVRSTHPMQVSTAVGAAGVQLGASLLSLAASFNKRHGVPMRRVCEILRDHLGLHLSPGGLSQAIDRIADRLVQPYEQLFKVLRASQAVHADETSWWLDGHSQWLWVFGTPRLTLYQIGSRSHQMVCDVLGDDYRGVLVSDCLAAYDPHPGAKSKCVAHHLKAISEALEQQPDSRFLICVKAIFKASIALHESRDKLAPEDYRERAECLERGLEKLLSRPHGSPHDVRIANRLLKHRAHLFTFLQLPGVDPTNNLAERQLRPLIIARKLSCGNKTERGKRSTEILASLAATCRQQGRSFSEWLVDWLPLTGPPPNSLLFPPN